MRISYWKIQFLGDDNFKHLFKIEANSGFNIKNKTNLYIKGDNIIFDAQFALFDNITSNGKKFIDSIFENMYTKYLDEKLWIDYHKKEAKTTNGNNLNIKEEKPHYYAGDKFNDEDPYKIDFSNSIDELQKLCSKLKLIKKNKTYRKEIIQMSSYSAEIQSENGLIYAFFDLIFQDNSNFRVKKCDMCKEYFITTNNNKTEYCKRIGEDGLTCYERYKLFHTTSIQKLEKRIRDIIRSNQNLCDDFKEYRKKLKLECGNNINKYVYNLIEKFYKTKEKKRNLIKELDLSQYLDNKYLNELDL